MWCVHKVFAAWILSVFSTTKPLVGKRRLILLRISWQFTCFCEVWMSSIYTPMYCTCTSWGLVTLIDYWTWVTKTFQILYFKIRNFKYWFLSNISQQIYILHLSYNMKTIWFVQTKVESMQVGNFTFQIRTVHLKRSMFI